MGFTLTEVLIAAGVLGGLGLVLMHLTKEQSKASIQAKIDSDIAQAKSEIASILSNPAHCNANFFGKAGGTTPIDVTGVFTCPTTTTGSCKPGTPTNKFPERTGATWTGTGISDRVRVSTVTVTINDVDPVAPATAVISTAQVAVLMQSKNLNNTVKNERTITFNAPVVYNGTTVTGCPKSINSTVPF